MKAIYVSPTTTVIKTEAPRLMAGTNGQMDLNSNTDNPLHHADSGTDNTGPGTAGNESHDGGDDITDAAKRNWNWWDVE